MVHYYFDLIDDNGLSVDEDGLEISSLRVVQAEAAKALADMARDAVVNGPTKQCMAINVRDNDGPVMQVRFSFEVQRCKN